MSTSVMALCWPLQMPPTPKAVLISLADNANDQGHCWPSIPTICERTCFGERTVHGAIKWLEDHGVLRADRSNGRHTRYVVTPSAYEPPQELRHRSKCATAEDAVEPPQELRQPPQEMQSPPQEMRSNRQEPSLTVKKSNRQKGAITVELPDWLPADLWTDWVEHRKSIRKPMSQRAAELSIGQLDALRGKGFTPRQVIENAIVCGWQGLYEPKDGRGGVSQLSASGNRQKQLEERNRRVADAWANGDSPASRRRL